MAVYACSDLHGNKYLWDAIKDFLAPDDILYYLGDATDRGPDGWAILKEMLNDKRVNYIIGNHDIMLADRIELPNNYRIANLHNSNGGNPTWKHAQNDEEAKNIKLILDSLPYYAVYTNADGLKIYMSHSGSLNTDNQESLVWDRNEYFNRSKPEPYDIVVHGHTTIPHLLEDLTEFNLFYSEEGDEKYDIPEWEGGALWYNNYRCDIDCCTVVTNHTVLLNLDTFDEEIFTM